METGNHWYEALPALFQAELETMQHGLDFFKFAGKMNGDHEKSGHLKYLGVISLSDGTMQLVQVQFLSSYPYSPPEVYALHGSFSAESGPQIKQELLPNGSFKITKSFGRGNQYANDKLCLFRDEDAWEPFTQGVGMVLRQAQRWLETAMSDVGFTEALIVEESNLPLQPVGQVLCYLPNQLPNAQKGILLLKPFKDNHYALLQLQAEEAPENQVIKSVPDGTVLSPGKQEMIFGTWIKLEGALSSLIPTLINPEGFKAQIQSNYKKQIEEMLPNPLVDPKKIIFGFIIEGKMQFFQITYWKLGVQVFMNIAYLLAKNLSKEVFSRIESLFSLDVLTAKKVLIIGLGSIGSEVAKELACCNIGNYTLIDDENFDVGNSVRHAADLTYIGERKVDVVKKIIEARNPKARVHSVPLNLFSIPARLFMELLQDTDVVLDFTANKLVEEYMHQKAFMETGKTLVQAAVSKGGLTGIVLVLKPGVSACLQCLKERKLNYVPVSTLDIELLKNAPPDYGACSQPALPASGMDTREVAIQAARATMQALLYGDQVFYPKLSGFQFYWHGPAGTEGHEPFEWEIKNAVPVPTCKICQQTS